jgi:hypothetical protein
MRRLRASAKDTAAEERAFERSVAMPPPPSIALHAAYGLRQRTRHFVRRLAKTALCGSRWTLAAGNLGRGLRRRFVVHVVHVVG